ncbi:cyclin B [Gorgonomyces haynaldii]|nr:cyclin B [Gorgonomyces haynaldii]
MFAANNQNVARTRLAAKKLQNAQQVPDKVPTKKRSALGDVSNVNKTDNAKTKKPAKPVKKTEEKKAEEKKTVKKEEERPIIEKKKLRSTKPEPTFNAPVKEKAPEIQPTQPVQTVHQSKRVKTEEFEDLDAEDANDPLMVSEYVVEIFEYMRKLEVDTLPNPNYMDNQEKLAWKMRAVLADWLVEVHAKFRLLPETLYLTMNIVDRFLSRRVVDMTKLQLVGVTAMFVAAKYEEIIAPSIQNYLYVFDGCTDEEILSAERYILQVLDFGLSYPSPMSFLRRCSKADGYDNQTRTLAKYLMEISVIDHQFLPMTPSLIAASGLYLARRMLSRGQWDANLVHYSGYEEKEMVECVSLMLQFLATNQKYEALYKKYSAKKFMKAAIFAKDWIERHHGQMEMDNQVVGVQEETPESEEEAL